MSRRKRGAFSRCHRDERGSPVRPELWADDGKAVRRLRKTYFTAKRRLQQRGSERIAESYGDSLWDQIDDVFHRVTRGVVEYAESVENPVLVLEDLTYIRENMDYGEYMNRRLHGWGFAKLHAQIRYKATEKGIPVETVNPRNTSKACHACGEHGSRPRQATFRCSNDGCWVGEYQADVNGAINIADRYRSGESYRQSDRTSRQKAGDDVEKNRRFFDHWKSSISKNSATDGVVRESGALSSSRKALRAFRTTSLTGPQDSQAGNESRSDSFAHQKSKISGDDAETQQVTRGTYAS